MDLHFKFGSCSSFNSGDLSARTDKQTDRQRNKQINTHNSVDEASDLRKNIYTLCGIVIIQYILNKYKNTLTV